jgi:DNA-binding transcriptional regulator YhcF (GntR family)
MSRPPNSVLRAELDRDSDVPVGVQLAWQLRSLIGAGSLQAGERLPGVRELGMLAGVNPNTVRAVYARLEADGLISTQHGRGTFVAARANADERLGEIVERAAREAQEAGLDPREVAAALYVNRSEGAAAQAEPDDEARERRAVRAEIAALEQRLADSRLQRLLGAAADGSPGVSEARTATGGRILSLAELRTLRDELAGTVALLEGAERSRVRDAELRRTGKEAAAEASDAAAARATERAAQPPRRLKLTPGPVRWSLRYEG